MKALNKFWFYHHSDKNIIYFAEGDEYEYVISGGELEHPNSRSPDEVESYFQKGYWVLTIPDRFRVVGNLTGIEYSFLKDANNLYAHRSTIDSTPKFRSKEWVMEGLYEERLWTPLGEEYDEERVKKRIKDLATSDNFKFRHWSDCRHIGQIFSATRCDGGYRIDWVDCDTGESRKMMYSNEEVECYLSGGDWIVVEDVSVEEKPSVKKLISINVNSVRAAAEFDVTNNKHTTKNNFSVEEIEQEILKYVREMYSGLMSGEFAWGYRVIGTRSYVVRFQAEDDNCGVISVEVDPSIGMPLFYASVEDFLNQN